MNEFGCKLIHNKKRKRILKWNDYWHEPFGIGIFYVFFYADLLLSDVRVSLIIWTRNEYYFAFYCMRAKKVSAFR